jgi:hypothetical protein
LSKVPEPEQPKVSQLVMIWDHVKRIWVKGYRKDIAKLPEVYELTWTNATTTNVAPDHDTEIDVERASSIAVQADSTDSDSTATSIDINVHCSVMDKVWDTTPYAEMNIGDAEVKTMLVNPGPFKIRIRLDNNTGASRADVRVIVKVRE